MRIVLFFIVVLCCIFTTTLAFADIISYTSTSFNAASMIGIGFCLLCIAKIGRLTLQRSAEKSSKVNIKMTKSALSQATPLKY